MIKRILAVGLLAAVGGQAGAVTVSVNERFWDVSVVTDDFTSVLDTLDDQIWWGDVELARLFAAKVDDSFGLTNFDNPVQSINAGPFFVFQTQINQSNGFESFSAIAAVKSLTDGPNTTAIFTQGFTGPYLWTGEDDLYTYATAIDLGPVATPPPGCIPSNYTPPKCEPWRPDGLTPVPLPAALPMLLAGIGSLGFIARRRRNRAA